MFANVIFWTEAHSLDLGLFIGELSSTFGDKAYFCGFSQSKILSLEFQSIQYNKINWWISSCIYFFRTCAPKTIDRIYNTLFIHNYSLNRSLERRQKIDFPNVLFT